MENAKKPKHMGGIYNYFEGATINHMVINENYYGHSADQSGNGNEQVAMDKVVSKEKLTQAIENSQQYFWGNSAYAVVFCVLRDDFDMEPNKASFEKMIELLPYSKERSFTCPTGTIANAFSDNPIFSEIVSKWDEKNTMSRIVKLRDELRKQLK